MSKFAILCVDDEEIILRSLESLLDENFGEYCLIELSQSAKEGLEIIEDFMKDGIEVVVIISDWLMPGIKGDEFLIKVHEICPTMEKIMLSGQADEHAIQKAKNAQALDQFVSKPWDRLKLLNLIRDALKKQGCLVPEIK